MKPINFFYFASMSSISSFVIRVYGLLLYNNKVLLCKEKIRDFEFVKFPGGGLEFGEGLKDALNREFKEELNLEIEIISHLYTTDFFQQSAFKQTDQVISVYYLVKAKYEKFFINEDFISVGNDHVLKPFWVDLNNLEVDIVSFPIDQWLIKNYKNYLLNL